MSVGERTGEIARRFALPDGTPVRVGERDGVEMIILGREPRRLRPSLDVSVSFAVYCPFAGDHHLGTAAGLPGSAVWVDVSSSPSAYFAALLDWWSRGETFAIVEHDVVGRADVFAEFEDCPELWCSYPYDDICHPACQEAWRNQLGCVRFRAEIIEAVPDAVSAIPSARWDWHNLCDGLGANLRAAGFSHHWHAPAVEHHHMDRHR